MNWQTAARWVLSMALCGCASPATGGGFYATSDSVAGPLSDGEGQDGGGDASDASSAETSDGLADASADASADVSVQCTFGASKSCNCSDGSPGTQTCADSGTAWNPCKCLIVSDAGASDTAQPLDGGGQGKDGGGGGGGGGGKDGGGLKDSTVSDTSLPDTTMTDGTTADGGGGDGGGADKEACLQANCATEYNACLASADCAALVACRKSCKGDKVCSDACVAKAPSAALTLDKAVNDCGKTYGCGKAGSATDAGAATD